MRQTTLTVQECGLFSGVKLIVIWSFVISRKSMSEHFEETGEI